MHYIFEMEGGFDRFQRKTVLELIQELDKVLLSLQKHIVHGSIANTLEN